MFCNSGLIQEYPIRFNLDRRTSKRFKGVLGDSSRGVFTGRVIVAEGASQTLAEQYNPNLLLSDRSRAVTRPQLEIYNDDVECSHGATVGQLDDDALFYLRARGLSKSLALRILTSAFVGEVRTRVEEYETLTHEIDHALMSALGIDRDGDLSTDLWIDWEQVNPVEDSP
jgi:Fe-S cluster assembly scaffold protein SufB